MTCLHHDLNLWKENNTCKCLYYICNTRICDLTLLFHRYIPHLEALPVKDPSSASAARIPGLRWFGVLFAGTSLHSSISVLFDPWPWALLDHLCTLWLLLRVSNLCTCSLSNPPPSPSLATCLLLSFCLEIFQSYSGSCDPLFLPPGNLPWPLDLLGFLCFQLLHTCSSSFHNSSSGHKSVSVVTEVCLSSCAVSRSRTSSFPVSRPVVRAYTTADTRE